MMKNFVQDHYETGYFLIPSIDKLCSRNYVVTGFKSGQMGNLNIKGENNG